MALLKWRNYLPVSLLMLPFAQPYISTFSRNNKFRTSEEVICHFNFSQLTLGITFPLPQELSSPSHTSQTPSPLPAFPLSPLQFISGSIQKNMLADFLPVLRLYDLLYPEMEPIPVPDINQCRSATQMAITCIWIHLQRKAQVRSATQMAITCIWIHLQRKAQVEGREEDISSNFI